MPDEIERLVNLRVLHINGNKLQTLPAELRKIRKLLVLDVGSNALKYNIANWQFDWNWYAGAISCIYCNFDLYDRMLTYNCK